MNKLLLVAFFFLAACRTVSAQDKHFTQFYAAPGALNPALAGAFEGKYRVGMLYRDQWHRVLDNPLKSFALGADLRFNLQTKNVKEDAVGLGLLFTQDKTGVIDFSTTQVAVALAYHKALDVDNRQFLSLGVQGGLTQRNLNYESLNFHDEFDGVTGYTLETAEVLPENNFSFPDLNVGLNYSAKIGRGNVFAGLAMHHVLRPNAAFYDDLTSTNPTQQGGRKLYSKYSMQLAANFVVNNRMAFLPRFLVANQGPHLEINTGGNFRFALGEYGAYALHLGSWVRPVRNTSGIGVDAVVLLAGMEFSNVLCGLSYDLNIGALTKARTRQGAFEISIAYLGSYDNEEILCPKF